MLGWNALPRPRPLSLALQGGGAHGAYTWGVLDALLESGRFDFDGISGTSAGAMNAIVMAHGLASVAAGASRPRAAEAAREALASFWEALATQLPFDWLTGGDVSNPTLSPAARILMQWSQVLAPHQLNPLQLNPLRDVLERHVDFERLRRDSPVRLFIAATQANTGRLRLFRNAEMSVDVALASACLPTLHPAVLIDGEPYWDGGYSANPALFPLVQHARAPDLLIVLLSNPQHTATPTSVADIRLRALEIGFNAAFLREAVALGEACAQARHPTFVIGAQERRLVRLRFHLIDASDALGHLSAHTRMLPHRPFLQWLFEQGRARTRAWLAHEGCRVGQLGTVDLQALFACRSPATLDDGRRADELLAG
ncbi:NTE family protein [Sphaerotilus hippei]|uniref:NTE family protein n=1 Tax=Sphaerotilus hippei TaxID=744406 RepID=A0A318H0Z5_9BURK|nr:patatin-like phospholipase family protein [Sphaerotilus hippei]PXW96268.1 NTE family protein [Sphaerotilus hippei]